MMRSYFYFEIFEILRPDQELVFAHDSLRCSIRAFANNLLLELLELLVLLPDLFLSILLNLLSKAVLSHSLSFQTLLKLRCVLFALFLKLHLHSVLLFFQELVVVLLTGR